MGADQRRDPGSVAERAEGDPFDDYPQRTRSENPREKRQDQQRDDRHNRRERRAELREDAVPEKRPDHVDVAVSEVEQLQDPVHHRVAERDQRVQAPEDDPVPEKLERSSPPERANRVDDVEEGEVQGLKILRNACGPPRWAARSIYAFSSLADANVLASALDVEDREVGGGRHVAGPLGRSCVLRQEPNRETEQRLRRAEVRLLDELVNLGA